MNTSDKLALILGGDEETNNVAASLSKLLNVIVLQNKEVPEEIRNRLGSVRFIYGSPKTLDPETCLVTTTQGEQIPYDYLVIATGPRKHHTVLESSVVINVDSVNSFDCQTVLNGAKSVTIIGGEKLGIEVAAQVLCANQIVSVTIIHSKASILSQYSRYTRKMATEFLESTKRCCIVNERNSSGTDKPTINTDVVINTSVVPNTDFMISSMLEKDGTVSVTKHLSTTKYPNIYAIGRLVHLQEQNAKLHARLVVHNIRSSLQNKKLKKMPPSLFTGDCIQLSDRCIEVSADGRAILKQKARVVAAL